MNKEPNTGNNWRYVWDDAGRLVGTSDARGCGVNFHYDGLGRIIGEDYSPCLASHPAYTSPNLTTGVGLETFYRYDAYEIDQVSPEPSFADDPKSALGHLVAVRDRGSYTRFNYDTRDRVRRVSRKIAKSEVSHLSSPYASPWFTSRLDYDLGDRITRRTTGVDVPELLMNGGSEERYAYSPRGRVSGIDSSYGSIVKSITYDPYGAPTHIVYGDGRGTAARFAYDNRHRLTLYQVIAPASSGFPTPIGHFDYRFSAYDEVDNPLVIEDFRIAWQPLPPDASPTEKRVMEYDDFYRLTRIDNTYKVRDGIAPWRSPFEAEMIAGDRQPVPLRTLPTRINQQTFSYDGLGNLTASTDDLSARYDRSLGPNLGYGTPDNGPNQLRTGEGFQAKYDDAGNLSDLQIERPGECSNGGISQCAQRFAYTWDEIGQLIRARRWDFDGNTLPPEALANTLPPGKPSWDLAYAYSLGARVRKTATDAAGVARHTLEVSSTLRVEGATATIGSDEYEVKADNMHAYLSGIGHVFYDTENRLPHQAPDSHVSMHLTIGDHLGSSTHVINHATSDLVERTGYQPYGAVESDYRPTKWRAFREPYKFTGKEEDIEVGATYFGERYYNAHLGKLMSADPLSVHGLGSDLNPYAYVGGRVTRLVDPSGLREAPPGATVYPDGSWIIETPGSDMQWEMGGGPNDTAEILIDERGGPALSAEPSKDADMRTGRADGVTNSQTLGDFGAGLLRGAAQGTPIVGSFIKPDSSNRYDPNAYEVGRGVGQVSIGLVEVVVGSGLVVEGSGAAVFGLATGPGEVVIGPAGIIVAAGGLAIAANGAASVTSGVQTLMSKGGGSLRNRDKTPKGKIERHDETFDKATADARARKRAIREGEDGKGLGTPDRLKLHKSGQGVKQGILDAIEEYLAGKD